MPTGIIVYLRLNNLGLPETATPFQFGLLSNSYQSYPFSSFPISQPINIKTNWYDDKYTIQIQLKGAYI